MGIYLNPGNENFKEVLNNKIYVDRQKQYFDSLSHYKGKLIFVGIDYSEKNKVHSCRIERFEKE